MKKFASLLITIFYVFSLAQPIFAIDVNAGNNGNGKNSINQSNVTVVKSTNVTQQNKGSIQNSVSLNLGTGSNLGSQNVGTVQIESGDIQVNTKTSNEINSNSLEMNCATCGQNDTVAVNQDNGSGSQNTVTISNKTDIQVSQNNQSKTVNDTDVNANTGNNEVDKNTGRAVIDTGDIAVTAVEKTKASQNILSDPPKENGGNVVQLQNINSGVGSKNKISIKKIATLTISAANSVSVNNTLAVDANTGNNHCDGNVGDCRIKSGNIAIALGIQNGVGKNETHTSTPSPTPSPTPPPSVTPSPTPTPQPTTWPGGGPGPISPTPTVPIPPIEAKEAPAPSPSPEEVKTENAAATKNETSPSLLSEIAQKIIPLAQAVAPSQEANKKGKVLGIAQLPITGLGSNPYQISLTDLWPGLLMLAVGLYLRKLTAPEPTPKRFTR